MASEIRVNKLNSQTGVGTITLSPTGVDISGITTAETLKATTGIVTTLTATTGIVTTLTANTTKITTGIVTTLTATTGIVTTLTTNTLTANSTAKVGSGVTLSPDGDVFATGVTTSSTVKVGGGVTISESGIEASGIGITCANINGTQIGGRRNFIINGAMQVAQRATSQASITSSGYFNVDRFRTAINTGQVTTSQSTDVPTGEGFKHSFKVDVTQADTSLSGTNFLHVQQPIEGQNLQSLNYGTSGAKTITVSFFVKSNKTGIYCICLEKTDNTRYDYTAEYTISSADTWEKKIITIAPDSNIKAAAGAIDNDNGKGLNLKFVLAAGGDRDNGTNNTWNSSTPAHSTSNQVNLLDSTSNEWYVTGVQLEIGTQATAFEHHNFAEELAFCQRYCMKWWNHGGTTNNHSRFAPGYYATTVQAALFFNHPVPMRATDGRTLTHNIGNMEQMTGGGNSNSLSIMADGSYNTSTTLLLTGLSGVTANTIYIGRVGGGQTNWYIIVSCEL